MKQTGQIMQRTSSEAVSHGEQQRIIEFLSDSCLDLRVSGKVYARGCLVQDDDRAPTEQRASHGDQLTLPIGEVRATWRNLSVECDFHLARLGFRNGGRC